MDNITFGIHLKKLRKQHNMTQEKLASLLNVSTSAVCKWEKGVNLPDINTFQKLSEILDVSLDELYNPNKTLTEFRCDDQKTPASVQSTTKRYMKEDTLAEKTLPSSHTPQKASILSRRLRIIIVVITFLALSIIGIFMYLHVHEKNNLHIYPYSSHITEDEYYGTVYETAYIYEGNLDSFDIPISFIEQINIDWTNNSEIPSDITIMKASFYQDKELARQWLSPIYNTYFLR